MPKGRSSRTSAKRSWKFGGKIWNNDSPLRAVEIDRALRGLHLKNSSIFDHDDEKAVGKVFRGEKMTEEEIEAADDN